MISVGNNKAVICKGDFRPAQLYKGDKKIAGYTVESFESENGVTLENCYNDKLHNAQIFGNSIQDGTPTPENPIEVQSVGELVTEGEYAGKYKIPVRARGKNLFDINDSKNLHKGIYGSCEKTEKGFKVTCTNSHSAFRLVLIIPKELFKEGEEYNISFKTNSTESLSVGEANNVNDTATITKYGRHYKTSNCCFTLTDIAKPYISFYFYGSYYEVGDILTVEDIQIEEGKTATEYEPYIEPQTFNVYLDEPLNYAKNVGVTYANKYSDYVDFNTQTLHTETTKIILTGDEPWQERTNCTNAFDYSMGKTIDGGFCTHYPSLKSSAIDNQNSVYVLKTNAIIITDLNYDNVNDFKAFLKSEYEAGTPITIICGLYNAQNEEPIELPDLPTFKGTTIYEIATEIPATISGKYKKVEE